MKKTMLVVLFFVCIGLFADGTLPTGTGTSGDPYQIATLDNLLWVSTNNTSWSSYFVQTADIDASATSTWNASEGFIPIGNGSTNFTGTYDGQEYAIDSLYINRPTSDLQSLFGYCNNATIENLGVTNVDVSGGSTTGGLVGISQYSTISNCYSTGSVSGTGSNIGGLVGIHSFFSTISNCYSTGSVSGVYDDIGGLVGVNLNYSTISNSYSTGSVSGDNNIGGLVGYNYESDISNCYSTGNVNGYSYTGGLVGLNEYSTISNSFWDTETSGQTTSAGGTGKTTAEMQTESTFTDAGWDFSSVWDINYYGLDYPYLRWQDPAPEGSIPNTPENIQIDLIDPDAIITWDAVTESIDGFSIVVDGYVVQYSENNIDFFYLQFTTQLNHTHTYVTIYSPQMYYQVLAVKNYSSRQLSYLKELNKGKGKLKWSEIKRNLERIEKSGN